MELLSEIQSAIRDHYVLTDQVDEVISALDTRADKLTANLGPQQLAQIVTTILREITNDMHFALMYSPAGQGSPQQAQTPIYFQQSARNNYYFEEAKRLTGNIGYLHIRMFSNARAALETAMGAMAFVAHTDALIFDIRQHRGGTPEMIQVLLSYLFDETTHINTFYHRSTDEYTQTWTLPYVPGKSLSHAPVYVLISSMTGSAGEEFAYDLQQLDRATLIGQTTAGAGHTACVVPVGDSYKLMVPHGRPINPISGTGWQGMGVVPDIETPAEEALRVAHLHALETLIEASADDMSRAYYQWEYETAQAHYQPYVVNDVSAYVGDYQGRQIIEENGMLVYHSPRMHQTLTPIAEHVFALGDEVRIRFADDQMQLIWRDQPRRETLTKLTNASA